MAPKLLAQINSSDIRRRLFSHTFWSIVGEVSSKGLMLLSLLFLARILTKAEYGEFGLVRSTINLFAILGGLGLGLTANRYVAEYSTKDRVMSGRIVGATYLLAIASGLVVGGVVLFGAKSIAENLLHANQLVLSLRIAGVLLVMNAINGAQIGVLQGLEEFKLLAIGNLCQGVIGLIALPVGARLAGPDGAVLGFVLYTLAGMSAFSVLIRVALKKQSITATLSGVSTVFSLVSSFAIPVALSGISIAPFKWMAEIIVARSAGFAALALFHASMAVITAYLAIVSTINSPLISLTASASHKSGSRNVQYVNLYASWFVFLVISLPGLLFPRLISILFGPAYNNPQFHTIVLLLTFYCGLLVYYQGILRMLTLRGSMWFPFITNLAEGATLIVALLCLSTNGVAGLATAYIASYIVRIAVTVPFLLRANMIPRRLIFDKAFLISAVAFSAIVSLQVMLIA